jgi:hypothetical protein
MRDGISGAPYFSPKIAAAMHDVATDQQHLCFPMLPRAAGCGNGAAG